MEESVRRLSAILKNHGYSLTKPRVAVFKFLHGKEAVSLNAAIKALHGTTDRASVYRTIALFQELGIVRRQNIGWKYTIELSDIFRGHHHHFTCIKCGQVIPISETALELFIDGLARQHGFTATEHQIELQGYCSRCKN